MIQTLSKEMVCKYAVSHGLVQLCGLGVHNEGTKHSLKGG